ncbi:2467_t:CDS:2, partial [Gigaspora rosea]
GRGLSEANYGESPSSGLRPIGSHVWRVTIKWPAIEFVAWQNYHGLDFMKDVCAIEKYKKCFNIVLSRSKGANLDKLRAVNNSEEIIKQDWEIWLKEKKT